MLDKLRGRLIARVKDKIMTNQDVECVFVMAAAADAIDDLMAKDIAQNGT